jgi:hypothetical protein
MIPARPAKIAAIASSGTEIPIDPRISSFWWSRRRFSARSRSLPLSSSRPLDLLEERCQHLILVLGPELAAGLDRRRELVLPDQVALAHVVFVRLRRLAINRSNLL